MEQGQFRARPLRRHSGRDPVHSLAGAALYRAALRCRSAGRGRQATNAYRSPGSRSAGQMSGNYGPRDS